MNIVIFGPEKRVGALQANRILDLNHGMTSISGTEANPIRNKKRRNAFRLNC